MTQQIEMEKTNQAARQEDGTARQTSEGPIGAPNVSAAPAAAEPGAAAGLDHLGRIRVRAAVELGTVELLVREVAALSPGSVVQLDRLVGEAADLTVNGVLVARGSVVVVDDHLGLRITELAAGGEGPSADA